MRGEVMMITLPGRCEFLSDAWIEEAKAFLERECRHRKERMAGRSFSISERFTNAPPHLKFADDVAQWSVRYDGENLAISRNFDESADLVVEVDYQAALTAAQFVGVLAPGAMGAMAREVATMFGKNASARRVPSRTNRRLKSRRCCTTIWGAARWKIPTWRIAPRARVSRAKFVRWKSRALRSSSTRFRPSSPMKCDPQRCARSCLIRLSR